MTALYHFYEIIRTGRILKREWLFCAVYDEQTAIKNVLKKMKAEVSTNE